LLVPSAVRATTQLERLIYELWLLCAANATFVYVLGYQLDFEVDPEPGKLGMLSWNDHPIVAGTLDVIAKIGPLALLATISTAVSKAPLAHATLATVRCASTSSLYLLQLKFWGGGGGGGDAVMVTAVGEGLYAIVAAMRAGQLIGPVGDAKQVSMIDLTWPGDANGEDKAYRERQERGSF